MKNKFSKYIIEYGTVNDAEEFFKLSRNTLMRLARAHNCVVQIGTRNYRINIRKLAECLEAEQEG